jgi:phosphoribosylaminoimidazole carboxylase (NCAIR synthetase)
MTNLIGQELHSDRSSESSKRSSEKKAAATQQRMQSELNNIKRTTKNPTGQSSGLSARQTTGQFHWYGKTETRPGRKMGHINYVGDNQDQLLKTALRERQKIFKQG